MQSLAPSEYFPGIKFNYSFYTTGDTKVTLEYVNNNFLKCVGYAYSRAISTSFNGIIYALGGIETTTINASGTITSNLFNGSGAGLTNLNASNISGGTLNVNIGGTGVNTFGAKRLLIGNDTNPITTTANLVYDTTTNTLYPINIGANGSKLTNLNVSNVTDGTLGVVRGGTGATNFTSDRILLGNGTNAITENGNLTFSTTTNTLTATNISGIHSGTGTALTALNASNISSGVLNVANGGTGVTALTADRLLIGGTTAITQSTGLTWTTATNTLTSTNFSGNGAAITNLNASSVSSGTLTVANGGTGQTTFGMNRILYGAGGNGAIATLADLTFDGSTSTLTCYGEFATYKGLMWMNQNSRLSRVLTANQFSTGTAIGDIVLISDAKLHLVGGSNGATVPALTINALNNVGIGNTAPAATDKLSITGNTKITGTATIDTNLVVGGSAGIIGTGNFTGNVGIGTGTIATNVLQVGAGGRLRISNGTTDYTLIGTIDTDGSTNTGITISGTTRSTNAGNIQYLATASGGSHIFYTTSTTTRMTITSSGVNINNDLGVTGNIGFGVAPAATYKLNVNGSTFINNQLKFSDRYTDLDNFPCNKINLLNSGGYGFGIFTSTLEYFSAFNHRFYTGSSTTSFGAEKMRIEGSTGIVYINDLNTDNGSAKLIVAGADANNIIAKFFNPSRTQGIGITFDGLRGLAPGGNQSIIMRPNGSGTFQVEGDKYVSGSSYQRNTYIYSGNEGSYIQLNFATPFTGSATLYKSAIIAEAISSYSRHHLAFCLNTEANNTAVASSGHVFIRLNAGNYIQFFKECRFLGDKWHNSMDGLNRFYLESSSTTYIKSGNTLGTQIAFRRGDDFTMGYFENNSFYAYLINLSDRRIKRDIVEINDETALNMLLLVQPTTYYYRDEARNKGNGKVYGFIAQQIKEVIPEAVKITKDIIANIYKTCLIYNKREIYHSIPQDVTIDTAVRILDKEDGEKGKCYKIKEIHEDHFIIDEDIEGDDCFVFGYCIDDLHGLDKSYIYTLNVCATQELHRRMEAQDKRIKELETKLEKLINYIYQ